MKNIVLTIICYALGLSVTLADVPKTGKFSITSGLKMEYIPNNKVKKDI